MCEDRLFKWCVQTCETGNFMKISQPPSNQQSLVSGCCKEGAAQFSASVIIVNFKDKNYRK